LSSTAKTPSVLHGKFLSPSQKEFGSCQLL
jgi:hypothetical protein